MSNATFRALVLEQEGGEVRCALREVERSALPEGEVLIKVAGGSELTTTVFPFILRGVNLLGIDSVYCPRERREQAWQRLARDLPRDKLEAMTHVVSLEEAVAVGRDILQGKVRGRVVVDVNA